MVGFARNIGVAPNYTAELWASMMDFYFVLKRISIV